MVGPDGVTIHSWLLDCLAEPSSQNPAEGFVVPARPEGSWKKLVVLAGRHGVAPLLYGRLRRAANWQETPESVRTVLRESFLKSAARSAWHFRELATVLRALEKAGIPCVVLKGSHLAAVVYEHPAHRVMVDIDLLIRFDDLTRAATELRALGFTDTAGGTTQTAARDGSGKHWPRMMKPQSPGVELHWRITRSNLPFQADVDGLWTRARTVNLGGVAARVLSPEDALLYVCTHMASHGRDSQGLGLAPFLLGLKPICDLAAIVRRHRTEFDWNQLQSRARDWHAEKCVYLSLWLAQELLRLEVPESVLQSLRPSDFDLRWGQLACDQIVMAGMEPAEAAVLRSNFTPFMEWDRRIHSQGSGRLRVLGQVFFPPQGGPSRRGAEPDSTAQSWPRRGRLNFRVLGLLARTARMAWYSVTHRRHTARYVDHIRNQSRLWAWLSEEGEPKSEDGGRGPGADSK